ncbi:MAG: hypothetical protein GY746_10440 [Gammaproteobacteria bacterium]|nr:hypothetical protein [Gammaproteobacteria bacterium]
MGSNNTVIGYQAGKGTALHNKYGNVFLGYMAGYSEHGSNKLYIENSNSSTPLIYGDFDTDSVVVNSKLTVTNTVYSSAFSSTSPLKLQTNGTTHIHVDDATGNVGVGTNSPEASAILEATSTSKGFLPPRMTSAQRDAISNPVNGLQIYNVSTNCLNFHYNSNWYEVCGICTPKPTPADAGFDQTDVCSPTTLTANTPGTGTGSWTIESGSGGSITDSLSPISSFSGTNGTTYTLRWTITTSCTTNYDDVDISFAILPTANAGEDVTICNGGNTTLNASGSTGAAPLSYSWNTGATNSSLNVTPTVTTTYTVTVSNICGSDIDEVTVTVHYAPSANAGADVTICNGVNTTLDASGSTGTAPLSYSWNTGAINSSLNVSPGVTTTYTVTVSNICGSASDEVTVSVHYAPSANAGGDVAICHGGNGTIDAIGSTGTAPLSYSWNTGATNSSLNVTPTITTTYTVTVSNTCGSDSDEVTVMNYLTDIRDGNTYTTVLIGTRCWMAENLAYLPSVYPSNSGSYTTPYYYVYGYHGVIIDSAKARSNYLTYGVLYNWPAAMAGHTSSNSVPSGVQGICPAGWHLPSDEEWKMLEGEVDSQYGYPDSEWDEDDWRGTDAGGNLKESGTTHWNSTNKGATNSSGFTALPAGYRDSNTSFRNLGENTSFWSSTESNSYSARGRFLIYFYTSVYRFIDLKDNGFSVRCTMD